MLFVIAIILVFLMVAPPKVNNTLEGDPAKAITTIQTAQVEYYSNYNRFAAPLAELGPESANLIERDLASGEKGGYKYTLTATPSGYNIAAVPSQYPSSGSKTFFSDQGMGIHQHSGPEPATVNDPLMGESAPQNQK